MRRILLIFFILHMPLGTQARANPPPKLMDELKMKAGQVQMLRALNDKIILDYEKRTAGVPLQLPGKGVGLWTWGLYRARTQWQFSQRATQQRIQEAIKNSMKSYLDLLIQIDEDVKDLWEVAKENKVSADQLEKIVKLNREIEIYKEIRSRFLQTTFGEIQLDPALSAGNLTWSKIDFAVVFVGILFLLLFLIKSFQGS